MTKNIKIKVNNKNNGENKMSKNKYINRDYGTYQNLEEKVDEYYGYRYTENEDGTINVKMNELHRWLDTKPIKVMGEYIDEDGYESQIWTELESLLENSVFGKVDMFGKEHRTPLKEVVDVITKVYKENGYKIKNNH